MLCTSVRYSLLKQFSRLQCDYACYYTLAPLHNTTVIMELSIVLSFSAISNRFITSGPERALRSMLTRILWSLVAIPSTRWPSGETKGSLGNAAPIIRHQSAVLVVKIYHLVKLQSQSVDASVTRLWWVHCTLFWIFWHLHHKYILASLSQLPLPDDILHLDLCRSFALG